MHRKLYACSAKTLSIEWACSSCSWSVLHNASPAHSCWPPHQKWRIKVHLYSAPVEFPASHSLRDHGRDKREAAAGCVLLASSTIGCCSFFPSNPVPLVCLCASHMHTSTWIHYFIIIPSNPNQTGVEVTKMYSSCSDLLTDTIKKFVCSLILPSSAQALFHSWLPSFGGVTM